MNPKKVFSKANLNPNQLKFNLFRIQALVPPIFSYRPISPFLVGITNSSDYSPFACPPRRRVFPIAIGMDGRSEQGDFYRRGFNSSDSYRKEKDDEVKGGGNSYTTEFRQYDARVGRWLSLDPLMAKFPWQSPYVAFDNNPIYFVAPVLSLSEEKGEKGWEKGEKGSEKKDNGVGSVTYDAQNGNLVLPERAKILATLQDGNNNHEVDYNVKQLEGEFGDYPISISNSKVKEK